MEKKLEGKVALITGASSGIGEATAVSLAAAGAHVVIAARREDRLAALAARIRSSGGICYHSVTDVSDEAQVRELMRWTHRCEDRLDILVNNAGVMLLGPIDGADTEDWRRMVNTNLLGLMYCTHAALPYMKARHEGHIVNISSVAGRTARAGAGVYNATKWGVGAFSEALRQEVFRDNIRVTVIEPGAVATELTDHITVESVKSEIKGWVDSMTPLASDDIAAAILYAVSQPAHVNVNEILIRPVEQER